jgi:hypothetical protein
MPNIREQVPLMISEPDLNPAEISIIFKVHHIRFTTSREVVIDKLAIWCVCAWDLCNHTYP